MTSKLTTVKVDEMFAAYCEKPTIHHIAQKCQVNRITARKYVERGDFAGRMARIKEKQEEIIDNHIARRKARIAKMLNTCIESYSAQLTGKLPMICPECGHQFQFPVPMLKAKFSDFAELIEKENLLLGEATERPEHKIKVEYVDAEQQNEMPQLQT